MVVGGSGGSDAGDRPRARRRRGAAAGARAPLDVCMRAGVDPNLPPEVSRHPLYRELALEHNIPVELE